MAGLGVGVCGLWFLGLLLLLCCVSVVGAWRFALLFAVFGSGSLYLVWVWFGTCWGFAVFVFYMVVWFVGSLVWRGRRASGVDL